ncbi:MAG: hypothetical protein AB7F99_09920 [Vicinamibacterales bacterium]
MRNRVLVLALLAMMCSTFAACASEPEPAAEAPETTGAAPAAPGELPATIVAERGGFIPEGIEYDPKSNRLLAGSLAEGTIFQIHPDGRVTAAISDAELGSSVGIEVDEARDRLLVANSDASVFQGQGTGQAKLGAYNLTTGQQLAMVDLSTAIPNAPADATYFANDVAVADDGTAYVTDTMRAAIYRVTPDYQVTLFHQFPPTEGLALNGIVYHSSGYLLVAGGETLYKVPVDKPAGMTVVKLGQPVAGQDGMVWASNGNLVIVSNSASRVVALRSGDDWASAEVTGVGQMTGQITTAAVVGDDIYVVSPHFADADPPSFSRADIQ